MTAGGCADARICLGAYVLGALDPADRSRVDAHLAECDGCRDELASFAALPGLLSRASIAEVEVVPEPLRPELLQRLLAAVAHDRRRERRVRWVGATAAAAVVVAAASVTGVAVSSSNHSTPKGITATGTNVATGLTASVIEQPKGWGAALEVHLTGALNSYVDRCQLVVVGKDGTRDVAASWAATPSGKIVADGATFLAPSQIKQFDIVGSDGENLVTVPAPGSTT
jgi:predicted anti-sigma-YlaC factor YlaD